MAGEDIQVAGQEGVEDAKTWLEKTGRVKVTFTVYEVGSTPFLTFPHCKGGDFSFDLCGELDLDDGVHPFYGEIKKYNTVGQQPAMYTEYLAKCYRASRAHDRPYHFVWITWHPFSQTKWTKLCTGDEVKAAVEEHKDVYCGADDVDLDVCEAVAERLWLIVLSERQSALSMTNTQLGILRAAAVNGSA